VNKRWDIGTLMETLRRHFPSEAGKRRRHVTFEYVMLR
jgi:adenine C2-methylase RlmN of 23S rRNA A2503 and tRNA A37